MIELSADHLILAIAAAGAFGYFVGWMFGYDTGRNQHAK